MSKHILVLAIAAVAGFSAEAIAEAPHHPGFGPLCDPGVDWRAVRDDRPAAARRAVYGDIYVFARDSTDEHLIVVIQPPDRSDLRELINYSDSAFEMPSEGFPHEMSKSTTTALRNRVVELGPGPSSAVKALEYTFVREAPQRRNWMANGYVLRLKSRTLIVQHSSSTPITDALAREMATQRIGKN